MKNLMLYILISIPVFSDCQVSFGLNTSGGIFTLKNNDHTFVLNPRKIYSFILGGNFEYKISSKSSINLQYDWSSLTVEGTQFGHVFYPPSGISFDRHNISAQYFYSIFPRLYLGFGYSKSLVNNFHMIDFYYKYKLWDYLTFFIFHLGLLFLEIFLHLFDCSKSVGNCILDLFW